MGIFTIFVNFFSFTQYTNSIQIQKPFQLQLPTPPIPVFQLMTKRKSTLDTRKSCKAKPFIPSKPPKLPKLRDDDSEDSGYEKKKPKRKPVVARKKVEYSSSTSDGDDDNGRVSERSSNEERTDDIVHSSQSESNHGVIIRREPVGKSKSKEVLILEIDRTRLLTDEQLKLLEHQVKAEADQNLKYSLQRLQNTFVQLKKKAKKTLRLVPSTSKGSKKGLFKRKVKKLFAFRDNPAKNGEKHYFCDICSNGRYFLCKLALKKHQKVHEGRSFRCTYPGCNSNFHDKNKLKRHIIIHTGERPFKCEMCGKRFGLEFNMKIHQRIHSGEKPFICSIPGCGRGFNQKTNLQVHERAHHGVYKPGCNPVESMVRRQVKEYSTAAQAFIRKLFKIKVIDNWTVNSRYENYTLDDSDYEFDYLREIKPEKYFIQMLKGMQRENQQSKVRYERDYAYVDSCFKDACAKVEQYRKASSSLGSMLGMIFGDLVRTLDCVFYIFRVLENIRDTCRDQIHAQKQRH